MSLSVVRWLDAAFDLDAVPGLVEVETVGWIVHQDEDIVCVAGEFLGDATRAHTTIPMVLVEEIRSLSEDHRMEDA